MNSLIFTLVLLFIVNLRCLSQELKIFHEDTTYHTYHKVLDILAVDNMYQLKKSLIEEGTISCYYDTGMTQIRKVFKIEDFQEHGTSKRYTTEGDLLWETDVKHGQIVVTREYYKEGALSRIYGQPSDTGTWVSYFHPNGTLRTQTLVNHRDFKEARFETEFYNDGNTRKITYFSSGSLDSVITYFPNGIVEEKEAYIGPEIHQYFFYWDGNPKREQHRTRNDKGEYRTVCTQFKLSGEYNKQIVVNNERIFEADYTKDGSLIRQIETEGQKGLIISH